MYVAAAALGMIAFFVAFSAIMRYVLGSPFGFTEEVVGLLYVTLVLLAIGYCAAFDREIRVELAYDALPDFLQLVGRFISRLSVILFALWFGYLALDFIQVSLRVGARTDVNRIALWPWMCLLIVMAIGLILAVFMPHREPSGAHADREPTAT
jgi:TRAP-type C4-dicarboxylate transport system permease small subunit